MEKYQCLTTELNLLTKQSAEQTASLPAHKEETWGGRALGARDKKITSVVLS